MLNADVPGAGCRKDRIDEAGGLIEVLPAKDESDHLVNYIIACIDPLTSAAHSSVVFRYFFMPRLPSVPEGDPAPHVSMKTDPDAML